jgi:hypothetical protein
MLIGQKSKMAASKSLYLVSKPRLFLGKITVNIEKRLRGHLEISLVIEMIRSYKTSKKNAIIVNF